MRSKRFSLLAAGILSVACVAASVQAGEGARPNPNVLTESFLSHHPDVKHRMLGLEALENNHFDDAFKQFQQASKYADKASQAMVADMYWQGMGVAEDPSLAYAWMDLAAERGYTTFVVKREKFWAALSPEQQQRAIEQGQAVYAEFGDDVAKPRLQRKLDQGRRNITGSRTGFTGALTVMIPGPTGAWISLDATQYYADKYWRPTDYFKWQDEVWENPPTGTVSIGDIAASATIQSSKQTTE